MNTREAIRISLDLSSAIVREYLADLSDAELLVRPVPVANHIAWQLGHLVHSEREMMERICPGSMPALPAGWGARYTTETSKLDAPGAFHRKADYLKLMEQVRAATLATLERLDESDFDRPAPEAYRDYAPSVGAVVSLQGTHWTMHAGQWAIVRRKLGRPPLY